MCVCVGGDALGGSYSSFCFRHSLIPPPQLSFMFLFFFLRSELLQTFERVEEEASISNALRALSIIQSRQSAMLLAVGGGVLSCNWGFTSVEKSRRISIVFEDFSRNSVFVFEPKWSPICNHFLPIISLPFHVNHPKQLSIRASFAQR